jgi:hypothetical protein
MEKNKNLFFMLGILKGLYILSNVDKLFRKMLKEKIAK